MGIEFLRTKSEQYTQKRDAILLRSDSEMLERLDPDRIVEIFNAKLRDPDTEIRLGFRLLVTFTTDVTAEVSQNARVIADLLPDDAVRLAGMLKLSEKPSGTLNMLPVSEPDFTGVFKLKAFKAIDIRPK